MNKVTDWDSSAEVWNNETATSYPAIEETLGVSLGYMFIGWTVLFAAAMYWRQTEAMDESKNNWGLLQWSSMFYCEGGAVMDFINALPHIMNLIPTATVYIGVYAYEQTGNPYWTFLTFFAGFGLVPILDLLIGEDSYNPTKKEEIAMRNNNWFRFHTVLYVWIYILSVCHFAKYVGENVKVNSIAFWGISTSLGISSGFGIGCIHEIIHRPTYWENYHGRLVLLFANYNHFWIEHIWGHHKRVATEEDPASSALNESFWSFIWKCLYMSFISACRIEDKFQKAKGRSFWNRHNRIVTPFLVSFAIDYIFYKYFGLSALCFQLVQSFLTAFFTDNANYIEHYGLRRDRLSDKKDQWGWYCDYERQGWMHAWNTGDRISNWMLFKIERHPDHHVNAGRPYQLLRTYKASPTYPTGYAGMFVLSWFPPIWKMVMNPIALKAKKDYEQQLKDGTYSKLFPAGANPISSVYKKTGEGHYEKGSQMECDIDMDKGNGGDIWAGDGVGVSGNTREAKKGQ
mmetsp:Transcript_2319/g.4930  ORF Transcript_2319/g.4930 Transcript_2319/m.4930 type:complete len:514 (-) Transcript_2319:126-1667(-)